MSSIDALLFVGVTVATAGGVFALVTEMVPFVADAGAATRPDVAPARSDALTRSDVAVTRSGTATARPAATPAPHVAPIRIKLR